MKKTILSLRLMMGMLVSLMVTSATAQTMTGNRRAGEQDDYRRSSLCLILVTRNGDKYARDIEAQFKAMPLPSRYNDLNIDVRVINAYSKMSDSDIASRLKRDGVAKQLVAKWFNRDYNGTMNMNRIHAWGGYNATYADLKRAQTTVRGVSLLSDEGAELIKNTFVLVCDISYYDRANTGMWLSALGQGLAAVANSYAQEQSRKGNYNNAQAYSSLSETFQMGATAAEDIAGFSVNVMARLYRLKWNDKLRDELYAQYWIDETTPVNEIASRKAAFDRDTRSYELEYLGRYRSRAGRTVSKSANDLNEVIRDVCSNAVDRSINNLSKMFPVFKPKTQFYCEGSNVYAYIGTKEGVTTKSKYEVLETRKTKDGFEYHAVGVLKPATIWNNQGLNIADADVETKYKGTRFVHASGKSDICDQGLLIREKGNLGYQYKRNRCHLTLSVGPVSVSESKLKDAVGSHKKNAREFTMDATAFNLQWGWMINYHTNFAWNPINLEFGSDFGNYLNMAATTGVILRTNPLGKNGRFAFYVWPSIGYRYATAKVDYIYDGTSSYTTYTTSKYTGKTTKKTNYYTTSMSNSETAVDIGGFAWDIKAGITLSEHWAVGFQYNDVSLGGHLSWYF